MGAATMAKFLAEVAPVNRKTLWIAPRVTFAVRRLAVCVPLFCALGLATNWYTAQAPPATRASKTQTRSEEGLFTTGGGAAGATGSGTRTGAGFRPGIADIDIDYYKGVCLATRVTSNMSTK